MNLQSSLRGMVPAAFAAGAILLVASPATAQVGAFGGTPTGVSAAYDGPAHQRAPILSENAVFGASGTLGASFVTGITMGSFDFFGTSVDYTVTQTVAALFYSPSDRLVVGATVQPWQEVEFSVPGESEAESGLGDAALYAKYRLWDSPDQASTFAVSGTLGLPIGDEGFGANGTVVALDGAFSRQLERSSIHASAGIVIPSDDEDGPNVVRLSGGLMHAVGDRVSVGGDLIARFSDGEHTADLAPGLRFQASPRFFIDAAFLVNLSTSLGHTYDSGLMLAFRYAGGG